VKCGFHYTYFYRTCNSCVGTSHKSTSGPFQGPQQHLHRPTSGPFQGSAQYPHESTFQGPTLQVSLFWPITGQFIPTNHRPIYSDKSQMTHQPSGPNKRRPCGPVKPVFPAHTAWCTTRLRTINTVICWSAAIVISSNPTVSHSWINVCAHLLTYFIKIRRQI